MSVLRRLSFHIVGAVMMVLAVLAGQSPAFPQYEEFAGKVLQKHLSRQPVTQRELLLLMTQPQDFKNIIAAWRAAGADDLVTQALAMRQAIFRRALSQITADASGRLTAIIALGSWADDLNPGDMDALVRGSRKTVSEFNKLMSDEIERIFSQESDDLVAAYLGQGARFTVETFEIYVSTLDDFGTEVFKTTYREAFDEFMRSGATAEAAEKAVTKIRSVADEVIRKNLRAQAWAAAHTEYYPGVAGQDFVRKYFHTPGKSRTWLVSSSGTLSEVNRGLPATAFTETALDDLGLSLKQMSGEFQMPVVANEYVEWMQRARLGPREQAKGLARAIKAGPGMEMYFTLMSDAERRAVLAASLIQHAGREDREFVKYILSLYQLDEDMFNKVGQRALWNILSYSNKQALHTIEGNVDDALSAAAQSRGKGKEAHLAKVKTEFHRVRDYLLGNEQLASLSKLDSDTLKALAKEMETTGAGLRFQQEWQALYELMAEGFEKEADDIVKFSITLVKEAVKQGRMSSEMADDVIKQLQAGKKLAEIADAERVIAVLRKDLADIAAVKAVATNAETVDDCLSVIRVWSKNPDRILLTEQAKEIIERLAKMSDIELLRLGFRDSEIATLQRLFHARQAGKDLSKVVARLKAKTPSEWKTSLRMMIVIGGGISLISAYNVITDPGIPEDEIEKRLAETMYSAFPTVGLILEGGPLVIDAAWQGYDIDWNGFGKSAAMATIEILGIAGGPIGGTIAIGALVAYGTHAVGTSIISNNEDREFLGALYAALPDKYRSEEGVDPLARIAVQGGERSLDTGNVQVVPNVGEKSMDVTHSQAFVDLYTDKGNVLLDTGERKPFTRTVRDALRDYAKRNVWSASRDLALWETAVRRYLPNIDLDQVESWKLGEVSEQAAEVSGKTFKVGGHIVRRYLNMRNLLVENTIVQLKLRLKDMLDTVQKDDDREEELRQIEKGLTMEERILPNLKKEKESFWEWAKTGAMSNQTRLEQVGAIWKRYLKTYREALTLYERWTKTFTEAALDIPTGSDLFGLSGVESEDKPKIDKVYTAYQTAFGTSAQEFKDAKGGPPDTTDPFDADAWQRLLNLRLRIFLGTLDHMKTTSSRLGGLEAEVKEVVQQVRDHYRGMVDISIEGPAEVELGNPVIVKAAPRAKTAAGLVEATDVTIAWTINGEEAEPGTRLGFSPTIEGTYTITATALRGPRMSVVGTKTHSVSVKSPASPTTDGTTGVTTTGTDDKTGKDNGTRKDKGKPKEPSVCSYKYSDWGECPRDKKIQTRSVIAKEPAACVERDKPVVEQACTPPKTEADKRTDYLNCLCRACGGSAGGYYGPSTTEKGGPCVCFGWLSGWRTPVPGGPPDHVRICYKGAYGHDPSDKELADADRDRKNENRKHTDPLKVKIKPSKNPAEFGDIVTLYAETTGGSGGNKWTWGGAAEDPKDANAKFVKTRTAGGGAVTVTVTDQDGNSASDSVTIQVQAITVKLEKESPQENTIPVGGTAKFIANVMSGKNNAGGSFKYQWQPHPELAFGDAKNPTFEQTGGSQMRNSARFSRPGPTKVWVQVLKEIEGRFATVGESEQITVEAVNPEVIITYTPKEVYLGKDLFLSAVTKPPMGEGMVSLFWDIPGYHTGSGSKATIRPKDMKPITATVTAKAVDGGDELGKQQVTVTPMGYTVTVSEPKYLGTPPQIWKCETQLGHAKDCGMVQIKPTQFAVHEAIFFKASVTPTAEGVNYAWKVDPSGSCGIPGGGSEARVQCGNTGTYTITARATKDGITLGEGSQTLTVSISQEMIDSGKKAKEAHEKLQKAKQLVADGKLQEGIALAKEAQGIDPKNAEATQLADKWSAEKQTTDGHVDKVKFFLQAEKIEDAAKELAEAKKLHPKYQPVVDVEKQFADARTKHNEKAKAAADKLDQANRAVAQGKLAEGIQLASEAAKIDPKSGEAKLLADKWSKEKQQADTDVGKVKDALKTDNLAEAEKALAASKAYHPTYQPVVDAEKQLADAKAKRQGDMKAAHEKVKQAEGLYMNGKIEEAIALLNDAKKIDPKNEDAPKLEQKWSSDLQQIITHVSRAQEHIKGRNFTEAKTALEQAQHINGNYRTIAETEHLLAQKLAEDKKLKVEENKKQEDDEKKNAADRLWDECASLVKQGRNKEALSACSESVRLWPNDKRLSALRDMERTVAQEEAKHLQEEAKKKTADALWDQCAALAKQNDLDAALAKCRESLSHWSSDKRTAAVRDLETQAAQMKREQQKRATADRLWDECATLVKQSRLTEALSKCRESLTHWSSEKRETAFRDLQIQVASTAGEGRPPTPPAETNVVTPPVEPPTKPEITPPVATPYYHVDLTPYGGKKGSPRKVKNIEVDDGSWIRLKATHEKRMNLSVPLPSPVTADSVAIVSNLDNAHYVKQGMTTTTLIVQTTAGDRAFDIKAGVHSSEWNRSEGSGADHQFPKESHLGDKRWLNVLPLPAGSVVTGFRFQQHDIDRKYYHGDAAPGFCLRGVTLVRSGTTAGSPPSAYGETGTAGASQTRSGKVIFDNGNIGGVYNTPTRQTSFTLNTAHVITMVQNYHWNNGSGTPSPGSISLRGSDGRTYGPWQAAGSPGQGGARNAYWKVYPNAALPAGTYVIVDSDSATWAQNSGSGGAGHSRVEGYPAGAGAATRGGSHQSSANHTTSGYQSLNAEIRNTSSSPVHVVMDSEQFGPGNRVMPGERKPSTYQMSGGIRTVKFSAGRNGQKLTECRWEYDPSQQNRVVVITFSEPNNLACATGVR